MTPSASELRLRLSALVAALLVPVCGITVGGVALCGGSVSAQDAQLPAFPGFEIEPYLTDLGPTRAHLNWRLREPRVAHLEWGLTLACSDGKLELEAGRQHEALLDGLLPGTRYHYRVDGAFQGSFRTLSQEGQLTFAVIGHTHGTEKFGRFPDALLVARLEELRPDFVVHCGDTTWFSTIDHFRRYFFELFAPLIQHTPVYVAPANHDAGWPFPHGVQLGTFKSLFRYPYPAEVEGDPEQARYAIESDDVQLLFVCYVSPMGPGSDTRQWLLQKFSEGEYAFRVVILGGGNPYYDEDSFFQFLSENPVDAVLMGDSRAPKDPWSVKAGVPTFFTGTGGDSAHPILWVEATSQYLAFRELNASGDALDRGWVYSRHVEPVLERLEIPEPTIAGKRLSYTFDLQAMASTARVRGLQARILCSGKRPGTFYAYLVPAGIETDARYRTEYARFQAKDGLLTVPLDWMDPETGEPIEFRRLRIVIEGVLPPEFELLESWLF